MGNPTVYGTPYSTYVRTTRIALAEKRADYELVDVNVLSGQQKQPEHLARNPFGTVPAFAHDGFALYETGAIVRYIDQVFPGPSLTPDDARARARMNQIISIVDFHAYPTMISKIATNRIFMPLLGGSCDEAAVEGASAKAMLCLAEIERILGDNAFLAGPALSLADCYVVPVLHYLALTPEKSLIDARPRLAAWWQRINEVATVRETAPRLP